MDASGGGAGFARPNNMDATGVGAGCDSAEKSGTPGAVVTAEGESTIALATAVAAERECTVERTSAVAEDRESPKAGNGEKDMANVPVVAGTAEELRVEENGSLDPPTAVGVDTSAVTGGERAPVADGRNACENVKFEPPTAAEAHTSAVAGKKKNSERRLGETLCYSGCL